MTLITNEGARLIARARDEGKTLVFGSVRMNTIFEPTPDELVYRSYDWYGANVGEVVGCLSHVSVDGVPFVCDSKLAILCNDSSNPWKSVGVYAHLEGESDEILFACESIENGDYADTTILELPVTLDGVVEDFGLSEGGSGGGGEGGSTAPLTGEWQNYSGEGSVEKPVDDDIQIFEDLSVGGGEAAIVLKRRENQYIGKEGVWGDVSYNVLRITSSGVSLNGSGAGWSSIINAAHINQGLDFSEIDPSDVKPSSVFKVGSWVLLVTNSEGQIESVRANGETLDVSVLVRDIHQGADHRVSGIVTFNDAVGISFESPIVSDTRLEVYVRWTRFV